MLNRSTAVIPPHGCFVCATRTIFSEHTHLDSLSVLLHHWPGSNVYAAS